ncbi:MAG: peptide deformylase [Planctomycetota bacterium]|jgi:peptide deformylase
MAIRKILTYPDKFLRQPTKPVLDIDSVIQELIDDMADTMYEAPGVGLAAIQVGCDQSILIYDRLPGEVNRSFEVLINPKIVDREGQIISQDEGCLSVPDFRADLKRAGSILVEGLDREGKPIQIEAEGNLAIVLQHEIDHLNGKLFIDHLSALKRELYKRRVKKMLRKK